MTEEQPGKFTIDPGVATFTEKMTVIGIIGALAVLFALKGNLEAATGFATAIVTYATARNGV